eukprot:m.61109 g.61109  ORF g.61109 m.61109 type:complete len:616 (+) comp17524_c1_seq1:72-1919(+)
MRRAATCAVRTRWGERARSAAVQTAVPSRGSVRDSCHTRTTLAPPRGNSGADSSGPPLATPRTCSTFGSSGWGSRQRGAALGTAQCGVAPRRASVRTMAGRAAAPAVGGDRGYAEAIEALNTLQTPARELAEQKRGGDRDLNKSFTHIKGFATRVGINDDQLNALSAVHVAGTKGKGSTCAMIEAILRAKGHKTGLYTSPHLLEARERIRINGVPISRAEFAAQFWACWDLLERTPNTDPTSPEMPTYFRFLTLLAFRVFIAEDVGVAVVEVGLGGRFDATNILPRPVVCGVTALGFDHTAILGNTLGEIAFQKGGIFKPGVPAVSSPQKDDGMAGLVGCAREAGLPLLVAPAFGAYGLEPTMLGIKGDHQKENASLALQLVRVWEAATGSTDHGDAIDNADEATAAAPHPVGDLVTLDGFTPHPKTTVALSTVRWPGRSQQMEWNGMQLYLDGAHTAESCAACAGWFGSVSPADSVASGSEDTLRVLMFNCTGGRDPADLLAPIVELSRNARIDVALFNPGATALAIQNPDQINRTVQPDELLAGSLKNVQCWDELQKGRANPVPAQAFPYLEQCVEHIQKLQKERSGVTVHVLVTGSVHFVGAFLNFIKADVI